MAKAKPKASTPSKQDAGGSEIIKPGFTIVVDNREQQGWTFRSFDTCLGCVAGTLKTGDYAIQGHENLIVVERKLSVNEIANNLKEARFERELVRLQADVKYPFILMEFDLQDVLDWPRSANLPANVKRRIKTTGPYLLRQISTLMIKYPKVQWIYCGNEGQKLALGLMKRVYEAELC